MKIPCTIDLRLGKNKAIVNDLIAIHGKSKDINQVGLEVQCIDDDGNKYRILQFHSSRHIVSFGIGG